MLISLTIIILRATLAEKAPLECLYVNHFCVYAIGLVACLLRELSLSCIQGQKGGTGDIGPPGKKGERVSN